MQMNESEEEKGGGQKKKKEEKGEGNNGPVVLSHKDGLSEYENWA